jgi:hypothetical protein
VRDEYARNHAVEMKAALRPFKIPQSGIGMIGRRLIVWHRHLLFGYQ